MMTSPQHHPETDLDITDPPPESPHDDDVTSSSPRAENGRSPRRRGSGMPASGIPAGGDGHGPPRGTTRPPFPAANTLRTTHGSRSPRVYLPLASDLAAGLLDARPDLEPYPVAVARWAEWEARALLMRRHLAEVGDLAGTGADAELRKGPTKWLKECENAAERAATVLGLDPRSEASLARERAAAHVAAVDLDTIAARGAAVNAARADDIAAGRMSAPQPDPAVLALERVKAEGRATWEQANAEHNAATARTASTVEPTTATTSTSEDD